MSAEEECLHSIGDVVWIKLRGNQWWPGLVIPTDPMPEGLMHLKRKPYCVVKFFNEDTYEYARSANQVCEFQCKIKEELIERGYRKFANDPILIKKFYDDVELAERASKIKMLSSAYFQRDNLYKRMKPYDFDDSERGTVFNIIQKNNKEFSTLSSKHVDGCYSSNILQRKKNIVCQPTDKTSAAATSNTNNCRYFKTVDSHIHILNVSARNTNDDKESNEEERQTAKDKKNTAKNINNSEIRPSTSKDIYNNNQNQYQCNVCNYSCNRQNVLILHHKIHSNSRSATTTSDQNNSNSSSSRKNNWNSSDVGTVKNTNRESVAKNSFEKSRNALNNSLNSIDNDIASSSSRSRASTEQRFLSMIDLSKTLINTNGNNVEKVNMTIEANSSTLGLQLSNVRSLNESQSSSTNNKIPSKLGKDLSNYSHLSSLTAPSSNNSKNRISSISNRNYIQNGDYSCSKTVSHNEGESDEIYAENVEKFNQLQQQRRQNSESSESSAISSGYDLNSTSINSNKGTSRGRRRKQRHIIKRTETDIQQEAEVEFDIDINTTNVTNDQIFTEQNNYSHNSNNSRNNNAVHFNRLPKKRGIISTSTTATTTTVTTTATATALIITTATTSTIGLEKSNNSRNLEKTSAANEDIDTILSFTSIPSRTSTPGRSNTYKSSEDIRRILLADWSDGEDEEDDQNNVNLEKEAEIVTEGQNVQGLINIITDETTEQYPSTEIEVNNTMTSTILPTVFGDRTDNTTTSMYTVGSNVCGNRIRNIPKKDRRDVVLKDFNNDIINDRNSVDEHHQHINNNKSSVISLKIRISKEEDFDGNEDVIAIEQEENEVIHLDSSGSDSSFVEIIEDENYNAVITITDDEPVDGNISEKCVKDSKSSVGSNEEFSIRKEEIQEIETKEMPETVSTINFDDKLSTKIEENLQEKEELISDNHRKLISEQSTPILTQNKSITTELISHNINKNVLSCFEFHEEDEIEPEHSVVSHYKKKYLSGEKTPIINNNQQQSKLQEHENVSISTITMTGEGEEKELSNVADERLIRDQQLRDEIETLLEQTAVAAQRVQQQVDDGSGSGDTTRKGIEMYVKGLPIKERGKRIFKSRNHLQAVDTINNIEDNGTEVVNNMSTVLPVLDENISKIPNIDTTVDNGMLLESIENKKQEEVQVISIEAQKDNIEELNNSMNIESSAIAMIANKTNFNEEIGQISNHEYNEEIINGLDILTEAAECSRRNETINDLLTIPTTMMVASTEMFESKIITNSIVRENVDNNQTASFTDKVIATKMVNKTVENEEIQKDANNCIADYDSPISMPEEDCDNKAEEKIQDGENMEIVKETMVEISEQRDISEKINDNVNENPDYLGKMTSERKIRRREEFSSISEDNESVHSDKILDKPKLMLNEQKNLTKVEENTGKISSLSKLITPTITTQAIFDADSTKNIQNDNERRNDVYDVNDQQEISTESNDNLNLSVLLVPTPDESKSTILSLEQPDIENSPSKYDDENERDNKINENTEDGDEDDHNDGEEESMEEHSDIIKNIRSSRDTEQSTTNYSYSDDNDDEDEEEEDVQNMRNIAALQVLSEDDINTSIEDSIDEESPAIEPLTPRMPDIIDTDDGSNKNLISGNSNVSTIENINIDIDHSDIASNEKNENDSKKIEQYVVKVDDQMKTQLVDESSTKNDNHPYSNLSNITIIETSQEFPETELDNKVEENVSEELIEMEEKTNLVNEKMENVKEQKTLDDRGYHSQSLQESFDEHKEMNRIVTKTDEKSDDSLQQLSIITSATTGRAAGKRRKVALSRKQSLSSSSLSSVESSKRTRRTRRVYETDEENKSEKMSDAGEDHHEHIMEMLELKPARSSTLNNLETDPNINLVEIKQAVVDKVKEQSQIVKREGRRGRNKNPPTRIQPRRGRSKGVVSPLMEQKSHEKIEETISNTLDSAEVVTVAKVKGGVTTSRRIGKRLLPELKENEVMEFVLPAKIVKDDDEELQTDTSQSQNERSSSLGTKSPQSLMFIDDEEVIEEEPETETEQVKSDYNNDESHTELDDEFLIEFDSIVNSQEQQQRQPNVHGRSNLKEQQTAAINIIDARTADDNDSKSMSEISTIPFSPLEDEAENEVISESSEEPSAPKRRKLNNKSNINIIDHQIILPKLESGNNNYNNLNPTEVTKSSSTDNVKNCVTLGYRQKAVNAAREARIIKVNSEEQREEIGAGIGISKSDTATKVLRNEMITTRCQSGMKLDADNSLILLQKKLSAGTKIVPLNLQATNASFMMGASTTIIPSSTKTSLEGTRSTFVIDCPIETTSTAMNVSSTSIGGSNTGNIGSTIIINPELSTNNRVINRTNPTETLIVNRKRLESGKPISQPKIQKVLFTSATPSTATFISPNGKTINLPTALLHNEQVLQELVQTGTTSSVLPEVEESSISSLLLTPSVLTSTTIVPTKEQQIASQNRVVQVTQTQGSSNNNATINTTLSQNIVRKMAPGKLVIQKSSIGHNFHQQQHQQQQQIVHKGKKYVIIKTSPAAVVMDTAQATVDGGGQKLLTTRRRIVQSKSGTISSSLPSSIAPIMNTVADITSTPPPQLMRTTKIIGGVKNIFANNTNIPAIAQQQLLQLQQQQQQQQQQQVQQQHLLITKTTNIVTQTTPFVTTAPFITGDEQILQQRQPRNRIQRTTNVTGDATVPATKTTIRLQQRQQTLQPISAAQLVANMSQQTKVQQQQTTRRQKQQQKQQVINQQQQLLLQQQQQYQQQQLEFLQQQQQQQQYIIQHSQDSSLMQQQQHILPTSATQEYSTIGNNLLLNTAPIEEVVQTETAVVDESLDQSSKILAVPTLPIPGYGETFLLCVLVDNTYRPIDNVPLYLDHGLNQLVPVPLEDIKEEPRLVVIHPLSPQPLVAEQNQAQQLQQQQQQQQPQPSQQQLPTGAFLSGGLPSSSLRSASNKNSALGAATGLSSIATIQAPFLNNQEQQEQQQQQLQTTPMILLPTEQSQQLIEESATAVDPQMYMFRVVDEVGESIPQQQIVSRLDQIEQQENDEQKRQLEQEEQQQQQQFLPNNNAVILNIGGQQIILDAATFAHLLANPDANTPLITDDGTEFVLTRDVLSALLIQHDAQSIVDMSSGDDTIEAVSASELASAVAHSGEYCPTNDILTSALPGPSVYGSDILQQTAAATAILQASHDGINMMATASGLNIANNNINTGQYQQQKRDTPPIQAKVNETNALLNQTPIMSVLESPRSAAVRAKMLTNNTVGSNNNLDDSLATIGVAVSQSALDLPITVTNPQIAAKVNINR